jgi:hypothetical protein
VTERTEPVPLAPSASAAGVEESVDMPTSSGARRKPDGNAATGWRSSFRRILFWSTVTVGTAASSWLSQDGLHFAGVRPVPVRVNPALLCVAAGCGVVVVGTVWSAYRGRRPLGSIRGTVAVLAFILFVGAIAAALHPGPGALAARDSLPPLEVQSASKSFGFPTFFANGASAAAAAEKRQLAAAFAVVRHCEAGTLYIRGFASSAPFRGRTQEQSRELNRVLANTRATETRDLLAKLTGVTAEIKEWGTYEAMAAERRLLDIGVDGKRILPVEMLNRRAEVFWNDSACASLVSKR